MAFSKELLEHSRKAALLIFFILACEISVGGGGQWISFRGFSIRMVMFCGLCLLSAPCLLANAKALLRNRAFLVWVPFAAALILGTVVALFRHNRLGPMVTDWKGFSFLVLVPVGICLLNKKETIKKLLCCLAVSSTVLSVVTLGLFFFMAHTDGSVAQRINDFVNRYHFGGFDCLYTGAFRIFFRSTVWAGFACCYYFYRGYQEENRIKRLLFANLVALNVMAVFISFTRTLYLGAFVGYILLCILFVLKDAAKVRRVVVFNLVVLLVFAIMVAGASAVNQVNLPAIALGRLSGPGAIDGTGSATTPSGPGNTIGNSTGPGAIDGTGSATTPGEPGNIIGQVQNQMAQSEQLREKTVAELFAMAKESILIGNGLGACIPSRDEVEYVYLDLLNKVGLVGLLAFLLPVAYFAYLLTKKAGNGDYLLYGTVFAATMVFYAASIFNPFLNNPIGLLATVILTGSSACLCGENSENGSKSDFKE